MQTRITTIQAYKRPAQIAGLDVQNCLSKPKIEHHHHNKSYNYADGSDVRFAVCVPFGDKLFDHDVDHSARGKAKRVRQYRAKRDYGDCTENARNRLYHAGQLTKEEALSARKAFPAQRYRHGSAFGKVLYPYTECKQKSAAKRSFRNPGRNSPKSNTNR